MKSISCENDLSQFRNAHSAETMLDRLGGDPHLCVNWPVGVGKSVHLDAVTLSALESNQYDLVIVLAPTRQLIEERKLVKDPLPHLKIVQLKPRPRLLCNGLNQRWEIYEKKHLGVLGRATLCNSCPNNTTCSWIKQWSDEYLNGVQVIYATQAYFEIIPDFLTTLKHKTGASKVLTIVDEANFLLKSFRRYLPMNALKHFLLLLDQVLSSSLLDTVNERVLLHWQKVVSELLLADTSDLRNQKWHLPHLSTALCERLQKGGVNNFGDHYEFIGYSLLEFCRSPQISQERLENGALTFCRSLHIEGDSIIYSATVPLELLNYRLNVSANLYTDNTTFKNQGTQWFNIASPFGTRHYFRGNSKQILDFYAELIHQRLCQGKKILLVAKKCFVAYCAAQLNERLKVLGNLDVQIVVDNFASNDLRQAQTIPLVNYGIIGTNLFEDFECCYCLTGFYVNEEVINSTLQDSFASDFRVPISLNVDGYPKRRYVKVTRDEDQYSTVNMLAQDVLNYFEMGTVLQAVGRVRPYTKPREIITFQCADHPDFPYTREFNSLGEARTFFNIKTQKTQQLENRAQQIKECKAKGLTQKEAADRLSTSLRTVQRYWNKALESDPKL